MGGGGSTPLGEAMYRDLHQHQQRQAQSAIMQANTGNPYANSMGGLGGLGGLGPINQAASAVAGVQSAQPKSSKKHARKKLLLCEVQNAV